MPMITGGYTGFSDHRPWVREVRQAHVSVRMSSATDFRATRRILHSQAVIEWFARGRAGDRWWSMRPLDAATGRFSTANVVRDSERLLSLV
ncbi:hypothetical protein B4N89_31105 [Embleya scabrispora]|uniref:Uncharacterized protein n=1 Tax=Embleya scabrispora TaxID=159449 RepID=A0A1T3NPF4_9ACTN|nr:hypothetical protein B4N89_31105 [Embleya scabrispora]